MTYEELKEKHNTSCKWANPRHEESKLQINCVTWFRLQYPDLLLFSIPNGGARSKVEAGILKAEGVLPGVADLFVALPAKGYAGLFIEMKYGSGKQSPDQIKFEQNSTKLGYKYVVANSFETFMRTVNDYVR